MLPYVSTVPTYNHQDPKNPTPISRETSVSGPANQAPIRSPQIPCVDCRRGTVCPGRSINRRDQRSVHSNLRTQPVHADSPRLRAARRWRRDTASGHGVASRRGADVAVGPRVQAGPKACACGPRRGSPRNLDRLNSTKVRRCGAGSRRTDGRSRRSSARPGVMHALRRWGTVSLSF